MLVAARILAVDDSPTILEMIKAILIAGGYEVITAADGQEALNMARSEKPDLILLDVMLPKLDGYRVCRLLKFDQNYRHIGMFLENPVEPACRPVVKELLPPAGSDKFREDDGNKGFGRLAVDGVNVRYHRLNK